MTTPRRRTLLSLASAAAVAGCLFAATPALSAPASAADDGLVRVASPHTVDETIERLRAAIAAKGVTLFADIDHTANAEAMGLTMPDTHLLIFGSPKIGAPLMTANPAIGIDLPIKVVVYADNAGRVIVAYNDPAYLADRHGLAADLPPFQGMTKTLEGFVAAAVKN